MWIQAHTEQRARRHTAATQSEGTHTGDDQWRAQIRSTSYANTPGHTRAPPSQFHGQRLPPRHNPRCCSLSPIHNYPTRLKKIWLYKKGFKKKSYKKERLRRRELAVRELSANNSTAQGPLCARFAIGVNVGLSWLWQALGGNCARRAAANSTRARRACL